MLQTNAHLKYFSPTDFDGFIQIKKKNTHFTQESRTHSKNSSDGVREFIGRVIFNCKRAGIQQSGVAHLFRNIKMVGNTHSKKCQM